MICRSVLRQLLVAVLSCCTIGGIRYATAEAQIAPPAPAVKVLLPAGFAGDNLGEGDDYFTLVLHNPRDMSDKEDLTWPVFGVHNIQYQNGLWSGTVANEGSASAIYALYPGYTAYPTGDADDQSVAEIGSTGWNYPVDAHKYTQLSFRRKAPPQAEGAWWQVGYTNISFTYEIDHVEGIYPPQADHWQVVTASLPWQPPIYGLEYRFGPISGTYHFDWLRLTDPATSPVYDILFWVGNVQAGDTVDLMCYTAAAATPADFCGPIALDLSTNTAGFYQHSWRTAYLPPGRYYVQAIVQRGAQLASDLSPGALTILPAPLIAFDNPSMTSGPDYATEVWGNPWDMNDDSDIFTAADLHRGPHDFVAPCPCFADGELYGTVARLDPDNAAEFGDPFVYLRLGYRRPIDTARYHYLTYRYKIDRENWWANSGERLIFDDARQVYSAAWLVRGVFFGTFPPDLVKSSNSLNDLIVFDDWNTYSIDLAQAARRGQWEPQTLQTGSYWTGFKTAFRFDFLEGVDPWVIHLDDVKLTGDDRAGDSYVVGWSRLGAGVSQSIEFYADPDPAKCLTHGILIYKWLAAGQPPAGGAYRLFLPLIRQAAAGSASRFVWDTSRVSAGRYFLCARATDGYNTSTAVSEAAVIVSH
jgi:hypothetical protein